MLRAEDADSHSLATILLIAITILLALLVLLLFHLPALEWSSGIPAIFVITSIHHESELYPHSLNYDSRIILRHSGSQEMKNDDLEAKIYKNGIPLRCNISTLNGHNFIGTHHYGVQWIGGSGCQGVFWSPGETLIIDLTDGTIRPGDTIRVDVLERSGKRVISRHTYQT
ncbi:MAG: type IV pilin [Methanomicrobiales archaeon]|nr:type IV pilin [Methanomicrobiales archaeon]MDI6876533.1 type IV pilin [Methanomicrobiales archaeon]